MKKKMKLNLKPIDDRIRMQTQYKFHKDIIKKNVDNYTHILNRMKNCLAYPHNISCISFNVCLILFVSIGCLHISLCFLTFFTSHFLLLSSLYFASSNQTLFLLLLTRNRYDKKGGGMCAVSFSKFP